MASLRTASVEESRNRTCASAAALMPSTSKRVKRIFFHFRILLRITKRVLLKVHLVLRRTQQAAGGLDVLAARGADRRLDAFGRQRVAEADHRLVVGREVGRSGNSVEADEVDAALDAVEQAAQLADVARQSRSARS